MYLCLPFPHSSLSSLLLSAAASFSDPDPQPHPPAHPHPHPPTHLSSARFAAMQRQLDGSGKSLVRSLDAPYAGEWGAASYRPQQRETEVLMRSLRLSLA